MGSINLAMLTFPNMFRINKVDVLARAPLWDAGLDFQHGTGHGIGAFLNVHEGIPPNSFYKTHSMKLPNLIETWAINQLHKLLYFILA